VSAGNQLTTLSNVKQWLGVDPSNVDSDAMFNRMIRVASAFVLNYLNRDSFDLSVYSDVYDGYGNTWMMLRRGPVYQIHAVSFSGVPIPPASGNGINNPYSGGWVLEPEYSVQGAQRLNFYGRATPRIRSSVYVQYSAGYVLTDEAHTIPQGQHHHIDTNELWLGDISVVNATNQSLFVRVSATPGPGQYTVANGAYTFNAANTGVPVLITYSYVPADVVQAATEIVGERYRYLDRIGQTSKSLGGQETVSFSKESLSEFIRELLNPYKSVTPV
jgi:hypothetical protein